MAVVRSSETRAEGVASELFTIRGWNVAHPPKGNLLWKNEYRDYPQLLEALEGRGKKGKGGDAYPDFILVNRATIQPLIVGETKAKDADIDQAISEACNSYGDAFGEKGFRVLAAGIAGDDKSNIAVSIKKHNRRGWQPVQYRREPIQWIPTPQEAELLLADVDLFELEPRVPSNEILAQRGDEINRLLRECKIKDEFRPAIMGAFMLGLWHAKGDVRMDSQHVLEDINSECKKAFTRAGKSGIANSILVPEANRALAVKAMRICHILRTLNITTLTADHDYIGQLYEMFFRFTGGNTIGQFFTPRHITAFMADLFNVSKRDVVVDPTCGTGGFLIAALNSMTEGKPITHDQINDIVKDHLKGFESEPTTAALCVANMVLRGDGTTGVTNADCFTDDTYPDGTASIVLGNPPFPHKDTDQPVERFIERGLEALSPRGKLAMIAPSSLIAKSEKTKSDWRSRILKSNSLKAVITLPSELFQPYAATTTAIVVLERGVAHRDDTKTFFCRIENDGFRLKKNVRIAQAGTQLPIALKAWRDGTSVPGLCTTTTMPDFRNGAEWAPGAYIEFASHQDSTLRNQIEFLIRGLCACHIYHADKFDELGRALATGELEVDYYRSLSGRKPTQVPMRQDTIGGLFDIYYGQKSLHNKENLTEGKSLIISSAGTDNGCYGFFNFRDLIRPPFVTVPSTGSIGETFIQTWPCGVTDDCLLLIPKESTEEESLFVAAAIIRLERWRFDYGRKITPERIASLRLRTSSDLLAWIKSRRLSVIHDATRIITESLETTKIMKQRADVPKETNDQRDSKIAQKRLNELRLAPAKIIRGNALEKRMKEWVS